MLEAAQGADAVRFGVLMDASHASLRDDYAVSGPALDTLVALLQSHPAVFGARLTGAGFGGACVALCAPGREDAVAASVLAAYAALGHAGSQQVPEPPVGPVMPPSADGAVQSGSGGATSGSPA